MGRDVGLGVPGMLQASQRVFESLLRLVSETITALKSQSPSASHSLDGDVLLTVARVAVFSLGSLAALASSRVVAKVRRLENLRRSCFLREPAVHMHVWIWSLSERRMERRSEADPCVAGSGTRHNAAIVLQAVAEQAGIPRMSIQGFLLLCLLPRQGATVSINPHVVRGGTGIKMGI